MARCAVEVQLFDFVRSLPWHFGCTSRDQHPDDEALLAKERAMKILVPLDGSSLAEEAVDTAINLAAGGPFTLSLLRATEAHGLPVADPIDAQVRVVREAEDYLAGVRGRLEKHGITDVDTSAWYGQAAPSILEGARLKKADLIVMSSHGRSGLGRLILGSVAESVLRSTRVPLCIVHGSKAASTELPAWQKQGANRRWKAYRRVLVALDGSPAAEKILPLVLGFAGPLGLEVTLMRVNVPVRPTIVEGTALTMLEDPETDQIGAEEYLAPLAVDLRRHGLRVKTQVRRGPAAEEILRAASESNVDLIAMTTHGRTGLGRLLLGSVAETVLRTTPLPVFLMRATPAEAPSLVSAARQGGER